MTRNVIFITTTLALIAAAGLFSVANSVHQQYASAVLKLDNSNEVSLRSLSYDYGLLSATATTEITSLPSYISDALGFIKDQPLYVKTTINYLSLSHEASNTFYIKQRKGGVEEENMNFSATIMTKFNGDGRIGYSGSAQFNSLVTTNNMINNVEFSGTVSSNLVDIDFNLTSGNFNDYHIGRFHLSAQNLQFSYSGQLDDCSFLCNGLLTLSADMISFWSSDKTGYKTTFEGLESVVKAKVSNKNNREELNLAVNSTSRVASWPSVFIKNVSLSGTLDGLEPHKLKDAINNLGMHSTSGTFFMRKALFNNLAYLLNDGFDFKINNFSGKTVNGDFTGNISLAMPNNEASNLIRNPLSALSKLKGQLNAEIEQSDIDDIAGAGTAQKLFSNGLVQLTDRQHRLKSNISLKDGVANINGKTLAL